MTTLRHAFLCLVIVGTTAAPALAGALLAPALGHTLTWDGNQGNHRNAPVPDNLARQAGATAFSDGELGSVTACRGSSHSTSFINDGVYGNCGAWISDPDVTGFAGIDLAGAALFELNAVAWSRDNLDGPGDPFYNDRWAGTYTLQYTRSLVVSALTPDVEWLTIGTVVFSQSPGFEGALRHQFTVGTTSGPLTARGFRLLVPNGAGGPTGAATAIDELELYGRAVPTAPVPEPHSLALTAAALGSLLVRRVRVHRREQR